MPEPSPSRPPIGSLAIIAIVVAGGAGAFAYMAGWLSPTRLTPTKIVDSLAPPGGPSLGHRRNHAKGICFTGVFESNGNGAELSSAQVFARGEYPALGRFNLATADANAPDSTVRVRGLGLQLSTPDGEVWRSAMIDPPFFTVWTRRRDGLSKRRSVRFTPENHRRKGWSRPSTRSTPSGKPAPPSFYRKSTRAGRCCRRSMMMAGFPAARWSGQP